MRRLRRKKQRIRYDIELELEFLNVAVIRRPITKIMAVLTIVCLNWFGLSAVIQTFAYFNDKETSLGNILSAGTLDFRLTNQNVSGFVGMENNGEIFHTSVAIPESDSMPMQYFAYSTLASPVCSEFRVRVKQNEAEIFNGPLPDFLSANTTVFGTWKFEFDLPVGASVAQGDLCQANIIFSAWREEVENPGESGFSDIETIPLNLKAKTIVLNEVLAYPNSIHPYPANREFIELKNNGNASVDAAGWKVSEMTGGGIENKYTITTAGGSYTASPYGGSTIIPAGGWLVLLLSDTTVLNNNGDTIRLYDSGDNKLDEYSYETAKYGLSDARYLDGIGAWVDPIPTPGESNEIQADENMQENTQAEPTQYQEPIQELENSIIVEELQDTEEIAVASESPATSDAVMTSDSAGEGQDIDGTIIEIQPIEEQPIIVESSAEEGETLQIGQPIEEQQVAEDVETENTEELSGTEPALQDDLSAGLPEEEIETTTIENGSNDSNIDNSGNIENESPETSSGEAGEIT